MIQKDSLSIQVLGSDQIQINQLCSTIAALLNKEVTGQLFNSTSHRQAFKDKNLPNILVFILDDLTIEALQLILALPSAARPALLVIAQSDNKTLMRLAMQAGARDYFVEPIAQGELSKSLNRIIFDLKRNQAHQGKITTVLNAKGGSGASFLTCNLAHVTASTTANSVVLMDMDLQFGTQSLNLDMRPKHTIVEALLDVAKLDYEALDGYMSHHASGLRLLSTLHEHVILPGEIPRENLDQLLLLAANNYERIFIDLPRQIEPLTATIVEKSDDILLVVQQSLAHMRDAKRLMRILRSELDIRDKQIKIICNRFDSSATLQLKDIQTSLEVDQVLTVPNDYERVAQSTNLGIPLFDYARKAPITEAIMDLLDSLGIEINPQFRQKGFFRRLFS